MIYLFEDRQYRLDNYYKKELNGNFIKQVKSFSCSKKENLEDYILENFNDPKADAILFHYSFQFLPNVDYNSEDVRKIFMDLNIPFAYFSGTMFSSVFYEGEQLTARINAVNLYANLDTFIAGVLNDSVNLPLLAFGENYNKNYLLQLQDEICSILFDKADEEKILGMQANIIRMTINRLLCLEELQTIKDNIFKELSDAKEKDLYTVCFLKEKIQNIINDLN